MITAIKNKHGTQIEVDGHILSIITERTDPIAVERFIALCRENEVELGGIAAECETRRQWNYDHPGQGKNWPVFNTKEKIIDRLLKQAGIRDS